MPADTRVKVVEISLGRAVNKPHAEYYVIHEGDTAFRLVLQQELHPRQSSSVHAHTSAAELYIVTKGTLEIRTDLGTCVVPENWSALVPPGVPHGVRNPSEMEPVVCILMLGSEYSKENVRVLGAGLLVD